MFIAHSEKKGAKTAPHRHRFCLQNTILRCYRHPMFHQMVISIPGMKLICTVLVLCSCVKLHTGAREWFPHLPQKLPWFCVEKSLIMEAIFSVYVQKKISQFL